MCLLAFSTVSCATRYSIKVDSINDGISHGTRYLLLPNDSKADGLLFGQFATYLDRGMTKNGYVRVGDVKDADIILFLGYGISDPQTNVATSIEPVTAYNPGKTYNYTGHTQYGGIGGFSANTRGQLKEEGSYQTTYHSVTETYTTYTRAVLLTAYSAEALRKGQAATAKPIWKTLVHSTGSSGDMRRVFPALVAGGAPYIGKDTKGEVPIDLMENSTELQEILNGPGDRGASISRF